MLVVSTALVACYDDPVAPSPVPETSVSIVFCAAAAPSWVAFRDGDGIWMREAPSTNAGRSTFRHVFRSERAAIASLTPVLDSQFTVLRVLYGAPSEIATEGDTTAVSCAVDAGKSLRGTVAGVDETQAATVNVGPTARVSVQPRLGLDFTVEGIANGPQDLLATRTTHNTSPTKLILRRDIDLPNGSQIPTLDFASAEAFDVLSANATIENLGGEPAVNFTTLITRHGSFTLPLVPGTLTSATQPYAAFPQAALLPSDLEQLHVSTGGPTFRTAEAFFRLAVNRTVRLGDPMTKPTITAVTSASTLLPRAHFVSQSDYDRLTLVVYEQPAKPAFVVVSMTPAYAARIGGYDLDAPDLSTVPGFDAAWALRPGLTTSWTASRVGGTLPIGRNAVPVDGATRRTVSLRDVITLP